jgi:hypothetical protein
MPTLSPVVRSAPTEIFGARRKIRRKHTTWAGSVNRSSLPRHIGAKPIQRLNGPCTNNQALNPFSRDSVCKNWRRKAQSANALRGTAKGASDILRKKRVKELLGLE